MRISPKLLAVSLTAVMLMGCNTWSTSKVDLKTSGMELQASGAPDAMAAIKPEKSAADILLTENDITERKYQVLGDIEVTVNKTTLFHKDPTRELVAQKLKEKAAELNADAVILVRYGTVGISMMSWGSLDGRGRAIAFIN